MADSVETKPRALREEEVPPLAPETPTFRQSKRFLWVAGGILVIVAISIFELWRYYSVRESTDDAQIEGHIHPVAARVGGTAIRVNFVNNQSVEAGAVLVQLDPKDYQVAVDRATADLAEAEAMMRAGQVQVPITSETTTSRLSDAQGAVEEARANLAAEQNNAEGARARLAMAQARLREAQANSRKAAKDLERLKPLIEKEEISQQQYDGVVAASDSLRAATDAAEAAVLDAQLGIQTADSHIASERAKLAQAEANLRAARTGPQQVAASRAQAESAQARWERAKSALEQAQLNLEYTTIRAAISGIANKKSVEVGQIVQPGQPLLALVGLDEVWVTANFKETQLKNMRPGQKVTIAVDAYGRKYDGHVDSIAGATGAKFSLLPPENATGNYVKVVQRVPVKILLEQGRDPEHLLRPGMSVVPTVITK